MVSVLQMQSGTSVKTQDGVLRCWKFEIYLQNTHLGSQVNCDCYII